MLNYFAEKKIDIAASLSEFLKEEENNFSQINIWAHDVISKILDFSLQGKMIRGGLSVLGYEMFSDISNKDIYKIATALEILQSAFLIHDDIMDRDEQRRGKDTIYYQYEKSAIMKNYPHPRHYGYSMGICSGDIAYFLAYAALNRIQTLPEIKNRIMTIYTNEIIKVGFAQMQDVHFGYINSCVKLEDIISMYRHKTARYTFTLPLLLGAEFSGTSENTSDLEKLSELYGIIFQIKDDELGLFGDEKSIGKEVGTDIKEGKKTIFYNFVINAENLPDKERILGFFGNQNIGENEINEIRNVVEDCGIRKDINKFVDELADEAEGFITGLCISDKHKVILQEILDYSIKRTK